MKKNWFLLLILLFSSLVFQAQEKRIQPYSKFSASLKQFLADENKDPRFIDIKNGISYVPVFIELQEGTNPNQLFDGSGSIVRTIAGNILTVDVPFGQLESFASLPEVKRMELPLLLRRNSDTLMKKFTTVDRVHRGDAPLSMPYKGNGVVIGIIDDGVEFGHPEFLDSTGKTRVYSIWNMEREGTPPTGYQYGHLWSNDTLNSFLNGPYNTGSPYYWQNLFGYAGHGTPVASLAAGNSGVAPGSTIIAVAFTATLDTLLRSDKLVDGIAYIYNTAKTLDKKCVINISLGTQWGGPHDGKTLLEKAIDNYCIVKPDLVICSSAGNDGNNWKHWGNFPIHADSSFGFARYAGEGSMYFSIPKQYSSSLKISVTDTRSPQLNSPAIHRDSILYQTPFLRIDSLIQSPVPVSFISRLKNGLMSAKISFTASHYNEDYDELVIKCEEFTSNQSNLFDYHISRFIFRGTGLVHGYYPFFNFHPLYFFGNNPYPNDPTYVSTDNEFTTAIPTNALTVLSTGAYNLRNCYTNTRLNVILNGYQPCRLTYFTSKGPTFDGRIKPDLINPGEMVLAARSRWDDYMGHYFILNHQTRMFDGTSASSPITAGMVALIWEKFPWFTRDSIVQRLKETTYQDSYTSAIPNNLAGWGKADVFKALTGMDTDLSHFCNDFKACSVFNPPPPPPPPPPASPVNSFEIFPNPSNGKFFLRYTSIERIRVSLFNSLGQLVHQFILLPSALQQVKEMQLPFLSQGVYYLRIAGKEYLNTKSILIAR